MLFLCYHGFKSYIFLFLLGVNRFFVLGNETDSEIEFCILILCLVTLSNSSYSAHLSVDYLTFDT